jgi:hypothetical protein
MPMRSPSSRQAAMSSSDRQGNVDQLRISKVRDTMNQNSKNWLALNASGLTWLVLTLGIMAFAGVLAAWSVQPHAIQ